MQTTLNHLDRALAAYKAGKLTPFDTGSDYSAYLIVLDGKEFIFSVFANTTCKGEHYGIQSV